MILVFFWWMVTIAFNKEIVIASFIQKAYKPSSMEVVLYSRTTLKLDGISTCFMTAKSLKLYFIQQNS